MEKNALKIVALIMAFIFFLSTSTAQAQSAYECLNKQGKFDSCNISVESGNLIMDFKDDSLDKVISGKKIQRLTGGEYARRRVAESVAMGILLTPLALFTLFSKKKRDNFGIEYIDSAGAPNATMIQMKKKYSLSLASQLQSISGKTIEYQEQRSKGK